MKSSTSLCCLLAALSPVSTFALGIRLADQDPFATARGNAFVATADNPSAIYYNPAGISQLEGHQFSLGTYAKPQMLPQLYYVFAPKEKPVAFGLGVYTPYGLSLEWPETSGFRTLAMQGRITYFTVNPVVAWQPHSSLSIAAGPTFNFAETDLRQGLFFAAPNSDQLRFKGDDTDVAFNLGVRWQPLEQHVFGVSYRSASTMNFAGTSQITGTGFADSTSTANARFPFPQNVIAGWSYRPTPNWNIEFNIDWTDWDRLNVVSLNQPAAAPFLNPLPLAFNWRSSFFYEWGVTRYFEKGWRASAGYIFSENSVPDVNFSPLIPDSDRHIFSLGVGRQYNHTRWDVGYQFAWGPTRTVSGSTASPLSGQSANGRYEFMSHALTFSVGFNF
jgi:long-chain fatty acid transport protein